MLALGTDTQGSGSCDGLVVGQAATAVRAWAWEAWAW